MSDPKSVSLILLLLGAHSAVLLIRITGDHFKPLERIPAEIQNLAKIPITFCVEIGQTSPSPNEIGIESTLYPFEVQANSGGKWHTLLIGPDVGSMRHPVVLEPGKFSLYSLRLRETGKTRLVLRYWEGSMAALDCGHPPKGMKKLESGAFFVQ